MFIRTALGYLVAGFALGGLLLSNAAWRVFPRAILALPLHVEWLFLGWVLQLAMGVAFWIAPRHGGVRRREWLGWLSYGLLNAGLLGSATAHIARAAAARRTLPWMFDVEAVAVSSAVLAFVIHLWPRVRPGMRSA